MLDVVHIKAYLNIFKKEALVACFRFFETKVSKFHGSTSHGFPEFTNYCEILSFPINTFLDFYCHRIKSE